MLNLSGTLVNILRFLNKKSCHLNADFSSQQYASNDTIKPILQSHE